MERIENIGFGELKLIQDPDQFCYGVDAVILADFAYSLCPDFKNAVDFGTGNGIIPIILSHKNKNAVITGVEIQAGAVELARRSCKLNNLEDRVNFVNTDITDFVSTDKIDIVTCNPPYFKKGGAIGSSSEAKFIARHETTATVEDFIKAAATVLKTGGHLFMVHRPSRLADIFYYSRKYGLEPKDMRMVVPKPSEAPNIVLIHCKKGAGRELNVMKELAVYDFNGGYSEEIEKIYEKR
ncbi:MAG: tRNA1(Val) (adenine(37)-N6)-methyltransferase [Bacillota bacterium]|nr:tRNA1(Val) (adenine(37)-N6)-methyltransferase [Bacillota bacterium]